MQGVFGKITGVMLTAGPGQVCGRIPERADSMLLRVLPPSSIGGSLRMSQQLSWRPGGTPGLDFDGARG